MSVRNLNYIREKDPKLHEALKDIVRQYEALAEQVNGNTAGQPIAPPAVSSVKVTGKNGHFAVAIQDEGPIYRDVHYYVEHADNPAFTNPQVIHLGHSRNHSLFLGNVTRYWRAYSAYASSPPGPAAYHGSVGMPQAVSGGGAIGGPDLLPSEGSGTGDAGQGLAGPGVTPFRSKSGRPPVRGASAKTSGSEGGLNVPGPPASAGLPPGGAVSGGGGGSPAISFISTTQAGLAALAATLNAASAGLQVWVSDYDHWLRWTGVAWRFNDGDRSGYIRGFVVDPNPTTGWKLCDGLGDDGVAIGVAHPVSYLNSDGTLSTITSATVAPCIPNLVATPAYCKFGAASTGVVAAVAPALTMNSYTPAGTNGAPALTMNSYTPAGTIADHTIVATKQGAAAGNVVTTATHVFTGTAAVLTGSVAAPVFTGTAAVLTGTVAATAEPPSVVLRPWFRK